MPPEQDRLSEDAARSIWRRAAQLQAEAERRLEESHRLPATTRHASPTDGLHPDDVRAAAEEAGIAPEFVQIALAEASALIGPSSVMSPGDILGSRFFLGATQHTMEATATVPGSVDSVSAAVLQVFSGHPCLLQAGEVAELPSWQGRVFVFNVPKFDWSASANPPFVEKAAAIGLKQLHVAVRPLPGEAASCEVVVAGNLQPGMRKYWRWSAAMSVGATAAGGAAGVGFAAASAVAGALLIGPAVLGAAALSGASVGAWVWGYRSYRSAVEESLKDTLQLLPAAVRAMTATRGPVLS
jgi:eukaryotic-like serine/threonine-protein kinase